MMTPKEKAKWLVDKFYYSFPNNGSLNTGINSCDSRWGEAIQCALITCNEVMGDMGADRGYAYWSEVKSSVNELRERHENRWGGGRQ